MKNLLFIILSVFVFTAASAQKKYVAPVVNDGKELKQASALFSNQHGVIFNLEDDATSHSAASYFNILDWLQGRVAGLQVYTLNNGYRIPVIRNSLASVYVDEIRVDYSYLNVLPVMDIAAVQVVKQPMGLNAPGGAILVYTKTGDED